MEASRRRLGDRGFSLIEIMVALGLVAVLLTLGAFAVRRFWLVRSLSGAQDRVVTQLRTLQESSVAESHPVVYGAFFYSGEVEHAPWGEARFNPDATPGDECEITPGSFDAGVYFSQVETTTSLPGIDAADFSEMVTACGTAAQASVGADGAPDGFLFYLARGVANSGESTLTLVQPSLDSERSVRIVGLTGRVIKL